MSVNDIKKEEFASVGVARRLELPAFRYKQGGRTQYSTVISVLEVPTLVARKPDPNKPLDGNRKVDGPRAKRFGEYVNDKQDWVSPAIFVGVPKEHNSLRFVEKVAFDNGSSFGILSIPSNETQHVLLVDGQHRTLGFHTLDEIIDERRRTLLRMIELAERFERGVQEAIDGRSLPWHVTRLGCRVEYLFSRERPVNGSEAASRGDALLDRLIHLYALNRGVLLTPFHNMALMSPATTEADVDRHTGVFASAVRELVAPAILES